MSRPLISIISPFAGSAIIKHFIKSVQRQTLDPDLFELILVDDRSQSTGLSLNEDHSGLPLHIIPFHKPEQFSGHTAGICRNLGARFASGDYFLFIDSDCILDPHCLEEYHQSLMNFPDAILYGATHELPAINRDQLPDPADVQFNDLEAVCRIDHRIEEIESSRANENRWDFWYSCNAMAPKSRFESVGGFDEKGFRCHDMDLSFKLFKQEGVFMYCHKAKVVHIEHSRSIKSYYEQIQGLLQIAHKYAELDAYVFDMVVRKQRSQLRVAEQCESRFIAVTAGIMGYRLGYCLIAPPGSTKETIMEALTYVPYEVVNNPDNIQFVLGLDRNCWDYKIILPLFSDASSPVIAVCIPLFNAGKKIRKTLESVFTQSIQHFEVLVIDDASDDDSLAGIKEYMHDSRLRIISLPQNTGLSKALNRGLYSCNAPLFLHLDSDDWLEQCALETVVNAFNTDGEVAAVYSDAYIHTGTQTTMQKGYQAESPIAYLSYKPYQVARTYRRKFLLEMGGWNISDAYQGRFYEDRLMLYSIASRFPVKWIDKRLYHVTDRSSSLSRSNPLTTASAKLSIGWHEANKTGMMLGYSYKAGRLDLTLQAPKPPLTFLRWSIIIPFHKNKTQLLYSVLSWLQSDFMETTGELIIVDDGSEEDLTGVADLNKQRIKILSIPSKKGAAYARNMGMVHAAYEMVFFSDADHIVPPAVLSMHTHRHFAAKTEGFVVGGIFGRRTFSHISGNIPVERKLRILEVYQSNEADFLRLAADIVGEEEFDLMREDDRLHIWRAAQQRSFTDAWLADWGKIILTYGENLANYKYKWSRLGTGSVSAKKSVMISLGGFDTNLKSMEDWELGMRAQQQNLSIICAPEAEPYHQVHLLDENRRENDQFAIRYLLSKHPQMIEEILSEKDGLMPPAHAFLKKVYNTYVNGFEAREMLVADFQNKKSGPDYCVLTFDDGPHYLSTPLILDTLKKYHAKAVFFLIGTSLVNNESIVKRIADEGHNIGIHHWVHSSTEDQTSTEVYEMLNRTMNAIRNITGVQPSLARPPYGKLTPSYLAACKRLNLAVLGWDLSAKDWYQNEGRQIIATLAANGIRNKVLLFHDGTGNPEATNMALDWLLQVVCKINISIDLPANGATMEKIPGLKIYNPFLETIGQ
jgi:glycosyltransferase involved in cell wall biosynthesis/peptidoglycan/xylan/chitin deacetylase (PgdA/CDA1 family)